MAEREVDIALSQTRRQAHFKACAKSMTCDRVALRVHILPTNVMTNEMPSTMPSLETIREMIKTRPRAMTFEHIALGCNVSVQWLKQLASGEADNPGYPRVKAIHDYIIANR